MSARTVLALLTAAAAASTQGAHAAAAECAARQGKESPVCVCNATYCDTLVRETPIGGRYVQYTTSKAGLRFSKTGGDVEQASAGLIDSIRTSLTGRVLLEVNTSVQFQTIEGFGGAVTDSAGINWLNMSQAVRNLIIQSYFGGEGLEYNMIRVPIGGSDFSTRAYAYNEQPEDDAQLTNFTLSPEDYQYKLPMLKAALAAATSAVKVVASTWSPPLWMKSNGKWSGFSRLKSEYYQTYADYHLKFIEEYWKQGVEVWAITTTNEPINGVVPLAQFNSLGWTPSSQARWLVDHLGPTLRNSSYRAVKILAVDDQRYTVPAWMHEMVATDSSVLEYLSGVAVHYYGDFAPASLVSWTHDTYPQLFILATEACEGSKPWQFEKVVLGSWQRATNYITDILTDLNHWVVGWIDWNLCLNSEGGPNWARNYVDSAVIVLPERDEFVKQPMFYAMGHFSKFVPPGSVRLQVRQTSWPLSGVDHVAFRTPRDTLVLIVYNSGRETTVEVVLRNSRKFTLVLPADTIASVELLSGREKTVEVVLDNFRKLTLALPADSIASVELLS